MQTFPTYPIENSEKVVAGETFSLYLLALYMYMYEYIYFSNNINAHRGPARAPSPSPEPEPRARAPSPEPEWSFIFGAPFRLTSRCKCDHCSKSLPYSARFSSKCCILSIFKEGARFPRLVISFWAISGIFSNKERDFRRF